MVEYYFDNNFWNNLQHFIKIIWSINSFFVVSDHYDPNGKLILNLVAKKGIHIERNLDQLNHIVCFIDSNGTNSGYYLGW